MTTLTDYAAGSSTAIQDALFTYAERTGQGVTREVVVQLLVDLMRWCDDVAAGRVCYCSDQERWPFPPALAETLSLESLLDDAAERYLNAVDPEA